MNDEDYMRRCIELSKEAKERGDQPFGCVIVLGGRIIAEASNDKNCKLNHHAEILAMNKATDVLVTNDLTGCTLYTNCEPCPMCAFMIREHKISRVVFAIHSPNMGGYSKWKILQDEGLGKYDNWFSKNTAVASGILEEEALKVFKGTPLTMFGRKNRQ